MTDRFAFFFELHESGRISLDRPFHGFEFCLDLCESFLMTVDDLDDHEHEADGDDTPKSWCVHLAAAQGGKVDWSANVRPYYGSSATGLPISADHKYTSDPVLI